MLTATEVGRIVKRKKKNLEGRGPPIFGFEILNDAMLARSCVVFEMGVKEVRVFMIDIVLLNTQL